VSFGFSPVLRLCCTKALIELNLKEKAMELLVLLLEDTDQDGLIRSSCAETMGKLKIGDKPTVERLRGSCAEAGVAVTGSCRR
jgi:HEAT repeat protein